MLQEQIATRTKKLAGAHEIHKFIANATDLLSRIHVRLVVPYADLLGGPMAGFCKTCLMCLGLWWSFHPIQRNRLLLCYLCCPLSYAVRYALWI